MSQPADNHRPKVVLDIQPLTRLNTGQIGKVVYLYTTNRDKLQKIMAMGILPGMAITLLQKFPSFVLQIGNSQFAVDKELAEIIFVETEVMLEKGGGESLPAGRGFGRRWRWGWLDMKMRRGPHQRFSDIKKERDVDQKS